LNYCPLARTELGAVQHQGLPAGSPLRSTPHHQKARALHAGSVDGVGDPDVAHRARCIGPTRSLRSVGQAAVIPTSAHAARHRNSLPRLIRTGVRHPSMRLCDRWWYGTTLPQSSYTRPSAPLTESGEAAADEPNGHDHPSSKQRDLLVSAGVGPPSALLGTLRSFARLPDRSHRSPLSGGTRSSRTSGSPGFTNCPVTGVTVGGSAHGFRALNIAGLEFSTAHRLGQGFITRPVLAPVARDNP
jgi:hypothetical protein